MNIHVRRVFAVLGAAATLTLAPACSSSNGNAGTSTTATTPQADVSHGAPSTKPVSQPENKLAACDILTAKQLNKVLDQKFRVARNEDEASMALAMDMTYHPQMCSFGEQDSRQEVVVTTRAKYAGCRVAICFTADYKKFNQSTGRQDVGYELPLNTTIEDSLVGVDRATLHFYKSKVENGYCLTCDGDLTMDFMFTYHGMRYFVTITTWARPQQMLDLASLAMHSAAIDALA